MQATETDHRLLAHLCMRWMRLLGVVACLQLTLTSCSGPRFVSIDNPCDHPIRVVTWDVAEPVVDVPASSVVKTEFSPWDGPLLVVSEGDRVALTAIVSEESRSNYSADFPIDGCTQARREPAGVVVIDDWTASEGHPVRFRFYSQHHDNETDANTIAAALPHPNPGISVEQGLTTFQFLAQGPPGWSRKEVEIDLSDGVAAALALAGSNAVLIECPGAECSEIETHSGGDLIEAVTFKARSDRSLAIDPPHVRVAQDVAPYAVVVLPCLVAIFVFLRRPRI